MAPTGETDLQVSGGTSGMNTYLRRDVAVEDEIFHCGYFADVVFKCRGLSGEVEDIYGQSALFALLSPVLRERLYSAGMAGSPLTFVGAAAGDELKSQRREVWLDDNITASGFQEVARYVYRLPLKLSLEKLPEVLGAAQALEITELEEAALSWGLANIATAAADPGNRGLPWVSEPSTAVSDCLRSFAQLCESGESSDTAVTWRDAFLRAHPLPEVLASSAILTLPPAALQIFLESEDVHRDPGALWQVCVQWARQRPVEDLPASREVAGNSAAFRDGAKPRKLFVPGARLITISAAYPPENETDWQRWLLPITDIFHFSRMDACTFASHVEAIDPMLPELRQAIYAARRRSLRTSGQGGAC